MSEGAKQQDRWQYHRALVLSTAFGIWATALTFCSTAAAAARPCKRGLQGRRPLDT